MPSLDDPIDAPFSELLGLLLNPGVAGAVVSHAAVRALHTAYGIEMPPLAQVAADHDLELVDGSVVARVPDAVPTGQAGLHRALAQALRAGAEEPGRILGVLARHAVRADAAAVTSTLHVPVDVARRQGAGNAYAALVAELDALAGDEPGGTALLQIVAWLAFDADTDEAPDLLARLTQASRSSGVSGVSGVAAAAEYNLSWVVDEQLAGTLRRSLRDDDFVPVGWSHRVRALEHFANQELADAVTLDRAAVLDAVARDDADLEASALLALGNAGALVGDTSSAIRLQRRAIDVATAGRAWRPATVALVNMAWMQVEQLDLTAAIASTEELVRLVEARGLSRYRDEAHLASASIVLLAGDRRRAARLLAELRPLPERPDDEHGAYDVAYRALRHAEISAGIDDAAAMHAAARARALVERFDTGDQDLELALVEAEVGDETTRAHARDFLPALIGSSEALLDAQAVVLLARRLLIERDATCAPLLRAALDRAEDHRAPVLALALDEARASLVAHPRPGRLVEVAQQWRQHGFLLDAALVEAGAGLTSLRAADGHRGTLLVDSAFRELSLLGAVRELARLKHARAAAIGVTERPGYRASGFLDLLGSSARAALAQVSHRRVVPAGATFPTHMVATLVNGVALVESRSDRIVDVVGPGATVGIGAVVDPAPSPFVVRALGPCTIDAIPVGTVVSHAADDADVALALARLSTAHAGRLHDVLARRAHPVLEARVCAVLADLAETLGPEDGSGARRLHRCVSRELLAALTGSSRETTSRVISKLVDDGVLVREGRSIVVADPQRLMKRATDAAPQK